MLLLTYDNETGGAVMAINDAILGLLSYKPMTGYDIKRIIQDSSFMHWSGNNNQIYKSLSELQDQGLVTSVEQHQEGSPTKKIYSITIDGREALKQWALLPPDPIEIKKPFLVQLAFSGQLNSTELRALIERYEYQVKMQLQMALGDQQKQQETPLIAEEAKLESTMWQFININIQRTYETELNWIQDLRTAIANIPNQNDVEDLAEQVQESEIEQDKKRNSKMNYVVKSCDGVNYVYFNNSESKLKKERHVLDVISVLAENDAQFVLFDKDVLSEDFLKLKKGLLETMLQKFTLYHINTGIVVEDKSELKTAFKKAIKESSDTLKLFSDIEEAEKWFLSKQD